MKRAYTTSVPSLKSRFLKLISDQPKPLEKVIKMNERSEAVLGEIIMKAAYLKERNERYPIKKSNLSLRKM